MRKHNIVPLPIAQRTTALERIYPDDDIFFHKKQLQVGTQLWHFGRLAPRSLWEVTKIVTYVRSKNHSYETPKNVSEIVKLHDVVYLHRLDMRDTPRQATFSYLSYSALWRLTR